MKNHEKQSFAFFSPPEPSQSLKISFLRSQVFIIFRMTPHEKRIFPHRNLRRTALNQHSPPVSSVTQCRFRLAYRCWSFSRIYSRVLVWRGYCTRRRLLVSHWTHWTHWTLEPLKTKTCECKLDCNCIH